MRGGKSQPCRCTYKATGRRPAMGVKSREAPAGRGCVLAVWWFEARGEVAVAVEGRRPPRTYPFVVFCVGSSKGTEFLNCSRAPCILLM